MADEGAVAAPVPSMGGDEWTGSSNATANTTVVAVMGGINTHVSDGDDYL